MRLGDSSSSRGGCLYRQRLSLTATLSLELTFVFLLSLSSSLLPSADGGGIAPCVFDGSSCECIVRSADGAPKNGNFSSPNYPSAYPKGTRCLYKFIGLPHERVQVRFHDFAIAGSPGRCQQDYVDVFVKIDHPDHSIFEVPLHDRYCGHGLSVVPHLLMSWNRTLSMTFISDDSAEERGFHGAYAFIDGAPYQAGNPRSSGTQCAFTLNSAARSSGTLLAPLYPAMYTDNIECQYQFEGRPGERVKITFEDFSLYHGGDHCPFDYVQIFDAEDNTDEETEIAKYCGPQPRFSVYSSKQFLSIKFKTKSGRNLSPAVGNNAAGGGNTTVYSVLRGFSASYVFSSDFVDLDHMPSGVVHVKGSECDTRVTSAHSPGGGEIASPYFPYPYPPNVTCYYYIDGRQLGGNHFERPSVEFVTFDVPSSDPECRRDSHLAAYLYGQDGAVDSADRYMCNVSAAAAGSGSPTMQHPAVLSSHANRLTLKFDTRGTSVLGRGFQARFRFITNDTAPTVQPPCHQVIRSSSQKYGTFAFPPSRSAHLGQARSGRCSYEFLPAADEYVVVSFEHFSMGDEIGASKTSSCHARRTRMDVSLLTAGKNASSGGSLLLPRSYCGSRLPGVLSADGWTSAAIHLTAIVEHRSNGGNAERAAFSGFYSFAPVPRASDPGCGASYVDTPLGVISSPGYPVSRQGFVDCEWRISATKPGSIIDLTPLDMDMAGSSEAGCKYAVLKVYKGQGMSADYELCGREREQHESRILSPTGVIRLRYIAHVPPGSRVWTQHKGFKLRWQLITGFSSPSCSGHVCNVTRTCLPEHLVCNKHYDCGSGDTSDEDGCDAAASRTSGASGDSPVLSGEVLYVIVGVATVVVVVIVAALVAICMCIRRLQRRADDAKPAPAAGSGGGGVTASSISAPICATATATQQHGLNGGGHVPSGVNGHGPVGSGRPTSDVMITSYPPPMSYPGLGGVPSGYLSLGRPYTRCPSTSSSSGGRAMTNSTWLSGRDVDNMPCLTVL